MQLTKVEWYALGGFANPKLYRKAKPNGIWLYFIMVD